jgi:hypothetical protein
MHTYEHKRELRERILRQREKLEAVLQDSDGHSAHARAVDAALAQLAMHLSGKWDDVDAVQAAQLTVWLESTRFLVHSRRAVEPAVPPPTVPTAKTTP